MSGHSKWSTIKHQKGVTDKRRGQAFSRAVKLITLAVKEGGGADASTNFKLRLAIDKAKTINMPKNNIDRAVARGAGNAEEGGLVELLYEGFGPHQSAILVECITDNKNRTISQVKSYFEKRGFSLGSSGSAAYLFDKKGEIIIAKGKNPEADQLKLMDFNPDDIIDAGEDFVLLCLPSDLDKLQHSLHKEGFAVKEFTLSFYPKSPIVLSDKEGKDLINFLTNLEDLEDVENAYTNVSLG